MCGRLEEVLGLFGELLERRAAVLLPQQLLQVGVSPPALQRESDSKQVKASSAAFEVTKERMNRVTVIRYATLSFFFITDRFKTYWATCSKCCSPSESDDEAPVGV